MNFHELCDLYLNARLAEGRSKRSYHSLERWKETFGDREVATIGREDVATAVDKITRERVWSHASRTQSLNVLSGVFSWAVSCGYAEGNPVCTVPRISGRRLNNTRKYVISKQKLEELFRVLELERPVYRACMLAVKTGMRFGKIRSLRKSDVRQDEHGRRHVDILDKNGEEHRVYFVGQARKIVQECLETAGPWLAGNPGGGQLRHDYVRDHLKPACGMVGIPYGTGKHQFSFHSFRRAFATHLLGAGVPIEQVMDAGNWKSFEVVRRYAINQDREAAFRAIDKVL